jgi:hypothetical protein
MTISTIPTGILNNSGAGSLGIGHRSPAEFPHRTIKTPEMKNTTNPIKEAQISTNKSTRREKIGRLRNVRFFDLVISTNVAALDLPGGLLPGHGLSAC